MNNQKKRDEIFYPLLRKYSGDPHATNLQVGVDGAGKKFGSNWVSLDRFDERPCIDFRDSLDATGFLPESFDFILCLAILEHVDHPRTCALEMHRIAKPGGRVWIESPFSNIYHPGERYGDHWRFSPSGLEIIMKPFKKIETFWLDHGNVGFYGEKLL